MKKITSVTAMLALAALLSSGAYAATASETTPTTNTNQQTFFDQTATLRANLAADRAELHALIAAKSQDTKRIRTLSENISKSEDELRLQARKNNVPLMGPGSMHLGMNCDSNGMMGKHMQGNMDHDMNGTMGNHHQM
jgi:hypothetical protein